MKRDPTLFVKLFTLVKSVCLVFGSKEGGICSIGSYKSHIKNGPCSGYSTCEPGSYCSGSLRYLCPAGRYGASFGLQNEFCSGNCSSGHYCPKGSVSSTERPCGNANFYCPVGSSIPIDVPIGYFSLNEDSDQDLESYRSSIQICPRGYWCWIEISLSCWFIW